MRHWFPQDSIFSNTKVITFCGSSWSVMAGYRHFMWGNAPSFETYTLRTILIGKTGTGKSSTANTLLGRKLFVAKRGGTAVTETCLEHTVTHNTGTYAVVDTPELFDTSSLAKRAMEIQKSINICPQPHAFLLVMNPDRVTPEVLCTIELLKMIFGRSVVNHMIVVFTHGGEFATDNEFESFWKDTPEYPNIVYECGGRLCRIENRLQLSPEGVHHNPVYDVIRQMSNFGNISYSYDYSEQHVAAFQYHLNYYNGNMDSIAQIQAIVRHIDHLVTEENDRREHLAIEQQENLQRETHKTQQKLDLAEQRLSAAAKREQQVNERLWMAQMQQSQSVQDLDRVFQQMELTNSRLERAEKELRREKTKRRKLKREIERDYYDGYSDD